MSGSVCLNCECVNSPEHTFCFRCGQKMNIHRITLHEIFHDAVHYFTHADKGIFYLISKLLKSPGVVAREYLAGKRTLYFKPLNFFLLVAALLVFMTSLLGSANPGSRGPVRGAVSSGTIPEAQKAAYAAMSVRAAKVTKFTTRYSNVINMLVTPLFALFVFLFYLRGQYTYIEHLVANMYFVGFIMIFYSLVIVPLMKLSDSTAIDGMLLLIFFIVEITYRGLAYYQLMNRKGAKHIIKAFGVSLLASILWAALSYSLIASYIRTGWGGLVS